MCIRDRYTSIYQVCDNSGVCHVTADWILRDEQRQNNKFNKKFVVGPERQQQLLLLWLVQSESITSILALYDRCYASGAGINCKLLSLLLLSGRGQKHLNLVRLGPKQAPRYILTLGKNAPHDPCLWSKTPCTCFSMKMPT